MLLFLAVPARIRMATSPIVIAAARGDVLPVLAPFPVSMMAGHPEGVEVSLVAAIAVRDFLLR